MARFDLQDFKKQASFFLRQKLNDARLALTDVSRMQLLTEEATNEDPWGPETKTMASLADAAFELEEYERIVQVIHYRLDGCQKRPWRQLYKTLVVLEYLLTHGPKSIGREFKTDVYWVEELSQVNLTDQQGIDRGLMVRKKADRVLELLNNPDYRNKERSRARKISVGIQGFESTRHDQVYPQDAFESIDEKCGSYDCKGCLASELTKQPTNAGAQIWQDELKGYEKCASMPFQPKQDGSISPVSEQSMSTSSQGKRSYKRSFSSPVYFRERLPMLRWQPARNNITESEDVDIRLLEGVDENLSSSEDVQGGLVGDVNTEGLSAPFVEDAHPLLETCSSADIRKSSTEHPMKISSFPMVPPLAISKLRMRFQHNWQTARFVKFGKAA